MEAVADVAAASMDVTVARSNTETFGATAIAHGADGTLWVAWSFDENEGPEGGIRLRGFDARGAPLTAEVVVARGSRGGFALGQLAALQDGRIAISWRGDEGLGWIATFGTNGRLVRAHYLEACDGAPSISADTGDDITAGWWGGARSGITVARANFSGPLQRQFRGASGTDSASLVRTDAGLGAVYCEGRVLRFWGALQGEFTAPSEAAIAHAPSVAWSPRGSFVVWICEDTGKLTLWAQRLGGEPRRVAEVWAPIDRIGGSAPSIAAPVEGLGAIAWREERGARPAVYLRRIDEEARVDGDEIRLTSREAIAHAGRPALTAMSSGWACAHIEVQDGFAAIRLRISAK